MMLNALDIKKTLQHHNIKSPLNKDSIEKLTVLAKDNTIWKKEIMRSMGSNP